MSALDDLVTASIDRAQSIGIDRMVGPVCSCLAPPEGRQLPVLVCYDLSCSQGSRLLGCWVIPHRYCPRCRFLLRAEDFVASIAGFVEHFPPEDLPASQVNDLLVLMATCDWELAWVGGMREAFQARRLM